ncbi:MAG: FAD-dependent oxidoreductase [Bryobacteraceae bacterium]|nr:FAD-dependent oxidoreductase [Bryobacteraceae bacterium]
MLLSSSAALAQTSGVYDYAIVGAGVFGTWIARNLHLAGQRVVLIDQYGPANNRASSGGETRIIRMGYGDREIYTQFSWRALELYKQFYAKLDPTLFQETGFLWLVRPGDTYAASNLPVFDRLKIPYEKLDTTALRKRYPQIELGPITWGLYEPNAGGLLARRGVQTVVRETVRQGLAYRQASIVSRQGTTLKTDAGDSISAGTVIYACGPWLRKLFPDVLGKKINPTRQEVFYFGAPADGSFRAPKMPAWIDAGDTIYGLPDIENRGFKLAPDQHGVTVDPDTQERLVPATSVARVREYVKRRFPKLANAPLTQTEVCQYENTANGDYLIDRHPGEKNVWLVGGGSGHGYKHGPALGEYVAGILLKNKEIDPRFLLAAKPDIAAHGRHSTIPPPEKK